MTREEAIARLEDTLEGWNMWALYNGSPASKVSKALGMAIAALRKQGDKDTNVPIKWISVEERLPTEKDANPNKSILAIEIREGLAREWIWDSVARYPKSFTHWMPLPDVPEVEV